MPHASPPFTQPLSLSPLMQKIRASLSSLFLNKPSKGELERVKQLEQLHLTHQGKPFVFDEGNLRFMYFNQKSVQSAMKINTPDHLLCGYTSAMMAFLLANPAPRHILMVGLGGGSLVKFCHRHLPQCRITALEIDADVIALRDQFMIPADDERLEIIHCDALDYLARHHASSGTPFDVILLDGFDIEGLVEDLNSSEFYASCHKALTPDGILVVNMWGKRKNLIPLLSKLRTLFKQNVWWCRSLDSYNLLVFSFKNRKTGFTTDMSATAKEIDTRFPLQLKQLSAHMHTLRLYMASAGPNPDAPSKTETASENDYDAREFFALSSDLAAIMVTDDSLPRNDVEWSALHQ
jgi:spermidine synthase